MSFEAVGTGAGNTLYSVTGDNAAWLALTANIRSNRISPEPQLTMWALVKVDIGVVKPVVAGISLAIMLVLATTAFFFFTESSVMLSIEGVCVTGTAHSRRIRAKRKV